ncbi:hypothetical protein ANN_05580 [Periplaneta americana]|uniref:Uncharacterized protein n=1 Tax=Periplaneta americana TaxID=6978 RepID=A0ABQ8TB75_PERAM|nr:hypothetical protein ANN_05580 [Periplaneta americana]
MQVSNHNITKLMKCQLQPQLRKTCRVKVLTTTEWNVFAVNFPLQPTSWKEQLSYRIIEELGHHSHLQLGLPESGKMEKRTSKKKTCLEGVETLSQVTEARPHLPQSISRHWFKSRRLDRNVPIVFGLLIAMDEVTLQWRKLHNAELHALYSSPDIIEESTARMMDVIWNTFCRRRN